MGNQVTKDKVSSAAQSVRKRMTIRRRRPECESEFSASEIQRKFNNIPILTADEQKVLKSSWVLIQKRLDEAGAQTFLSMFESNPETQNVFRKFQGIDLVQLEASSEISSHGTRVMNIVDMVIENLNNYQALWDNLIRLGRDHFGKLWIVTQ